MEITKIQEETTLTVALMGRLDTHSAPEADATLKDSLQGITTLRLDFTELEFLSSDGLRVLLSVQKIMNKQGTMVVFGVNEGIDEIFSITGFHDILTIET